MDNNEAEFLKFGNDTIYYLDIEELSKRTEVILPESSINEDSDQLDEEGNLVGKVSSITTTPETKDIDAVKYNTYHYLLQILLDKTLDDDVDDALGSGYVLEKKSLDFKIAFNTLIKDKILKTI
jgi:hypothetical protein